MRNKLRILQIFLGTRLDGDDDGNEVEGRAAFSKESTYFKQHFQYFSTVMKKKKKKENEQKQPHETKYQTENQQSKGQSRKANHH